MSEKKSSTKSSSSLLELEQVVAALRNPETGCPWDLKQTHESLMRYLIEESYEVGEAVENKDSEELQEELGDVLLQVYLHAQIASEEKIFTIEDVAAGVCQKMISRHPHVFGSKKSQSMSVEEVEKQWEALKLKEKSDRNSLLDGIPKSLPPTLKAERVLSRVAEPGFEWNSPEDAWNKVEEELQELRTANNKAELSEELGDLFFALTAWARKQGVDSHRSFSLSIDKFTQRFRGLERLLAEQGTTVQEASLDELLDLWHKVKRSFSS